ncbi:MAG: flagellar basal body rod protein FlgC [Betaproteobacteria bacterium]|nr:flagellar basal body rod protein FlgC [Betaproteobacteria bacterium]
MSLMNVFDIASSALSAQSQRLNVVASNLANADSAVSSDGTPYRGKQIVFQAQMLRQGSVAPAVKVKEIVDDPSPPRLVYDPGHPLADEKGYVTYPNVSVVEEMTNMISASRSYQLNADVMNTAKSLMLRTLSLGQ